MSGTNDLKPCPFCGDTRTEFNSGYRCYRIDCGAAGPMYSDPEKTLDRWQNAYCWNEISSLRSQLSSAEAKLKVAVEALERIGGPGGCGCSPVCTCEGQTALKIWKDEVRAFAQEALAHLREEKGDSQSKGEKP